MKEVVSVKVLRIYFQSDLFRSKLCSIKNTFSITMTTTKELEVQLAELEGKLTGDMFKDMDIRDQIHNLKMKLSGTKPINSEIDCVGCGS